MKISMNRLAEISAQSPGYSVTLPGGETLSNIQFSKTSSGRKDRQYVEADSSTNQYGWKVPSEKIITIED